MALGRSVGPGAKLHWLLITIVFLALVPMFALHVVRLRSASGEALDAARNEAAALARSGAAAHEQIAADARKFLEVLSLVPSVRNAQLPDCEQFLQLMMHGRNWLGGIFVVGPDGRGLCGANPMVRTLDVSDRDYFKDAVKTRDFVLSDVIIGRVSRQPVVAAALPLHDLSGDLISIVGVTVTLSWINEVAARANAEFGGILIALDRGGNLVAYQSREAPRWKIGAPVADPLAAAIMRSPLDSFEADDAAGVRRIFGVTRLPELGLTVAVGLDRREVLSAVDRNFRQELVFLVIVAAASFAVALLVAEFGILRGVRILKAAALRLKAGKIGLRVHLPPYVAAELHDLAATYNAMTAEFERLAYLDRLTGLPNRRYLERQLTARETTAPASQAVIAIDLDGFKPVNDSHGHAIGDRVLTLIARRIAGVVEGRGMLFRVGGDEFVALGPLRDGQDRATARGLAEEIRTAVERTIQFDGLEFVVPCSIGIALVPEDAETVSGALVVADSALYEAKRAGRNRVVDRAPALAPYEQIEASGETDWDEVRLRPSQP